MIVYHGTDNEYAASIMESGFSLCKDRISHGRMSGDGIYVTTEPKNAVNWTSGDPKDPKNGLILRCELKNGLRILWQDLDYDRAILEHLRKEFGKDLLKTLRVDKILPKNKQLTKSELIVLVNYFFHKRSRMLQKSCSNGWNKAIWNALNPLVKQMKLHGYEGVGDRTAQYWDSDEIVIFNPSNVVPISAHPFIAEWTDLDINLIEILPPISMSELKRRQKSALEYWNSRGPDG